MVKGFIKALNNQVYVQHQISKNMMSPFKIWKFQAMQSKNYVLFAVDCTSIHRLILYFSFFCFFTAKVFTAKFPVTSNIYFRKYWTKGNECMAQVPPGLLDRILKTNINKWLFIFKKKKNHWPCDQAKQWNKDYLSI